MPLGKHHIPTIKTAEILNGKVCAINRRGRDRSNISTYFVCVEIEHICLSLCCNS